VLTDLATAESPTGARSPGTFRHGAHARRRNWADPAGHLVAAALGVGVLVVHNVGYMLSAPYWVDEAWVADSTRAPLSQLPWLTSSTPLGWTFLLHYVPAGGTGGLRLLPLAFTVAATVCAFYVGNALPLPRPWTGLLTGSAVLLVPAMLVRDDLKQYTAEACASILLLLLVARVESGWSRGRLAAVGAVTAGGLLVTNTSAFVGLAGLVGLVVAALVRTEFRRAVEAAVALAVTAGVAGGVYLLVDRRHRNPELTSFWADYYVARGHGISGALTSVHGYLVGLAPYVGTRSLLVEAVLALGGIVGLVWLRRYALAVMIPLSIIVTIVASMFHEYPFGDLRTSTFWLVEVAVLMAVGVACALALVVRRARVVGAVGAVVVVVLAVVVVRPYIRSRPIPREDVAAQVAYVDGHRRPGDVVILSYAASWGFAYYEASPAPRFRPIDYADNGFLPVYPGVRWLVQMPDRRPADVVTALATAEATAARHGGRIWIIRSHLALPEAAAWSRLLAGKPVRQLPVGPEPLLVYSPPPAPAP